MSVIHTITPSLCITLKVVQQCHTCSTFNFIYFLYFFVCGLFILRSHIIKRYVLKEVYSPSNLGTDSTQFLLHSPCEFSIYRL